MHTQTLLRILTVVGGWRYQSVLYHFPLHLLFLSPLFSITGLTKVLNIDTVVREDRRITADCVNGNVWILQFQVLRSVAASPAKATVATE
jgi:hypothetical protein